MGVGPCPATDNPAMLLIDEMHAVELPVHSRRLKLPGPTSVHRTPDNSSVANGPAPIGINKRQRANASIAQHGPWRRVRFGTKLLRQAEKRQGDRGAEGHGPTVLARKHSR